MTTPAGSGRPELRISDTERESAVTALGEHYAAGRLTKEEYDERASTAYAARTASALRPLFVDLPAPHPFAGPAARAEEVPAGARRPRVGAWAGPSQGWDPRAPFGGPARARPGSRLPVLPLLLLLIGLTILVGAPWLVFLGLGLVFLARSHRGGLWGGCASRRHHAGHQR